jgi:hypothetical protein
MENPKSLTLTIKNLPDVSKGDVEELRSAFTRLRHRRPYCDLIRGGFYAIEPKPKPSEDGGGLEWHLHLHALVDMPFIPVCCEEMKQANAPEEIRRLEEERCSSCTKPCLRRDWQELTGSPVVHLRDARRKGQRRRVLEYVAGDFTKGGKGLSERLEGHALAIALYVILTVLEGVRLVQPFGLMLEGTIEEPDRFYCPRCGACDWSLPFMWTEEDERLWLLDCYIQRKLGLDHSHPP